MFDWLSQEVWKLYYRYILPYNRLSFHTKKTLKISITHLLDIKRCLINFFRINYVNNGLKRPFEKIWFSLNKMKSMILWIFNSLWNDLEKSYLTILKTGCLLYRHYCRLYKKKLKILKIKGVPKILCVLHIVNYLWNTPTDCPQIFFWDQWQSFL